MSNLTVAIRRLEQERLRLSSQLQGLNNALAALGTAGSSRTRRISAAGRARIAAAQRVRWAKVKGKAGFAKRTRRKLSEAARRKIIAAQRKRWAAWRRDQRKAA